MAVKAECTNVYMYQYWLSMHWEIERVCVSTHPFIKSHSLFTKWLTSRCSWGTEGKSELHKWTPHRLSKSRHPSVGVEGREQSCRRLFQHHRQRCTLLCVIFHVSSFVNIINGVYVFFFSFFPCPKCNSWHALLLLFCISSSVCSPPPLDH